MNALLTYGIPIIGGTVAQTVLQDPIKDMITNTKEIINIKNGKYDMLDLEVGYSPKYNKILNDKDIISCYNDVCIDKDILIKEKEQKIKNDVEQIYKNAKDEKIKITEYINMENMAFISSISFFAYTGYKIIKYIDNNI